MECLSLVIKFISSFRGWDVTLSWVCDGE